jgi:hypothetical protein
MILSITPLCSGAVEEMQLALGTTTAAAQKSVRMMKPLVICCEISMPCSSSVYSTQACSWQGEFWWITAYCNS